MLPNTAQDDDPDVRKLVQSLEDRAQLITLVHLYNVQRRAIKHDIRTFPGRIKMDLEAVEARGQEFLQFILFHDSMSCNGHWLLVVEGSCSRSTRRSILPTGDLGISSTKT